MTTDNFCFYLQNRLTQTSQTGGQQYSDTSPFSIPWLEVHLKIVSLRIVSEVDGLVDGQVRRSLVGGRRLRRQEVVDRVVVRPAP